MSRTFSTNSGSLESLNVSARCGFRAKARQMRQTAVWLRPVALASERVLQWVASAGVASSVVVTARSTCSSVILRGAPGAGGERLPRLPPAHPALQLDAVGVGQRDRDRMRVGHGRASASGGLTP